MRNALAAAWLVLSLCACNVVGPPSIDYADVEGRYVVTLTSVYSRGAIPPDGQDACSGTLTLLNQRDHTFDARLLISQGPGCGPNSGQFRGVVHPGGEILMQGSRDYSARGCTYVGSIFREDLFSGLFSPSEFTLRRRIQVICRFPGLGDQHFTSEETITAVRT